MPHDIPDRLTRLRTAMAAEGMDAILAFKPQNSFYVSGFNPILYSHPMLAIVTREGHATLLVHALRDDHARASSRVSDIRLYGAWSTKVTMGPSWLNALATILTELGVSPGRLGVDLDFLSVTRFRELETALSSCDLVDASAIFTECRAIKDPDEIADARAAGVMADIGMEEALAELRRGGTEREISIAAMAAMSRYWADTFPDKEVAGFGNLETGVHNGLSAWVLSGDRMFLNCDNPTNHKPAPGEMVSILIWSILNGVLVENERTVMIGEVEPIKQQAFEAILEIRDAVFAHIRPGNPISDLFDITKKGLEDRGFGRYIPGRIGHSIGLGAHEHPSIDAATRTPLKPGMILAIEPNIRIPGKAATQISDTILVTDEGFEYLTRSTGGLLRA